MMIIMVVVMMITFTLVGKLVSGTPDSGTFQTPPAFQNSFLYL
jgi:hypothetical protein